VSRYAENTSVSVESSRGEIERTLQRYGAASFAYGWDQERNRRSDADGYNRVGLRIHTTWPRRMSGAG
jgi:hypothetical protein